MKYLIVILFLVFSLGCNENNELRQERSIAARHLTDKGYEVVSFEGRVEGYELTKQKITVIPYIIEWGMQSVDPARYFGKIINVDKFIVKKHPLNKKGKVDVFVYMVGGQPVGGTSAPHGVQLAGGYWNLDGENTLPESYQDWRTEWLKKYAE